VSFAVEDEDIAEKYTSTDAASQEREAKALRNDEKEKKEGNKITFLGYTDLQQGFDNNVNLDSKRKRDFYFQNISNLEVKYEPTDKLDLKTGADIFNISYYNVNTNNILDVSPYVGFDIEFVPKKVKLKNHIAFDYFSYPNKKESSYSAVIYSTSLRQFVLKRLYHEIGYKHFYRWYPDKKISLDSAARGEYDKADERWRTHYTLGFFGKRFMVKFKNEIYKNDSNNEYQEYYDYWVYRAKPSVLYFITNDLYINLGYSYKYTLYEDRRATDDVNKVARDHTHSMSTALYYDLTKNVTCSITYSYAENLSNDPFQRYSGGTVTGGLSYNF